MNNPRWGASGVHFLALGVILGSAGSGMGAPSMEPASSAIRPERVAERIRQYRTVDAQVTVTDSGGRALPGRGVEVEQTEHRFRFGCNAFRLNPADDSVPQVEYQKRFVGLLNFATLPFYWGTYERVRDEPQVDRLRAMAVWCRERGLAVKGHPLCWHQVTPRWATQLGVDEVHELQLSRIRREVSAFRGLIDIWDVVNEAVIMPTFEREENPITALSQRVGRVPLVEEAFAAARQTHPGAVLILNDYDTSAKFEQLIETCLARGVGMEAIGIQSHMHTGYRGAEWAWETCERFARFGKPLHFTETTVISGTVRSDVRWHGPRHDDWPSTPEGERVQAEQVEEFYRVLFSHPAVEAITWWDFSDQGAWLGAPAGLLRADMTPKPVYDRLWSMIKGEWWTGRQTLTTDAEGRVRFRGFRGRYRLKVDGLTAEFELDRPGEVRVAAAVDK
jgi:endo-1,4-beta-xylanase